MQHVFANATIDFSENLFLVFKAKSLPTYRFCVALSDHLVFIFQF